MSNVDNKVAKSKSISNVVSDVHASVFTKMYHAAKKVSFIKLWAPTTDNELIADLSGVIFDYETRSIMQPGEISACVFKRTKKEKDNKTGAVKEKTLHTPILLFGTQYGTVCMHYPFECKNKTSFMADTKNCRIHVTDNFREAAMRFLEKNPSMLSQFDNATRRKMTIEIFIMHWVLTEDFDMDIAAQAAVDQDEGIIVGDGLPAYEAPPKKKKEYVPKMDNAPPIELSPEDEVKKVLDKARRMDAENAAKRRKEFEQQQKEIRASLAAADKQQKAIVQEQAANAAKQEQSGISNKELVSEISDNVTSVETQQVIQSMASQATQTLLSTKCLDISTIDIEQPSFVGVDEEQSGLPVTNENNQIDELVTHQSVSDTNQEQVSQSIVVNKNEVNVPVITLEETKAGEYQGVSVTQEEPKTNDSEFISLAQEPLLGTVMSEALKNAEQRRNHQHQHTHVNVTDVSDNHHDTYALNLPETTMTER